MQILREDIAEDFVVVTPCIMSPIRLQGEDEKSAAEIVAARDLRQITDYKEIEVLCRGIVDDPKNAKQVPSTEQNIFRSRLDARRHAKNALSENTWCATVNQPLSARCITGTRNKHAT